MKDKRSSTYGEKGRMHQDELEPAHNHAKPKGGGTTRKEHDCEQGKRQEEFDSTPRKPVQ